MAEHLLMIEDDAHLATMVGEYLRQSCHGFTHAADGVSGVEAHTTKFINQTCFLF
jgi:DNA-binding response OmpR family regulator